MFRIEIKKNKIWKFIMLADRTLSVPAFEVSWYYESLRLVYNNLKH